MAALDLGSNSFHLLIAEFKGDRLRVIDRLKDMVRLAEGLGDSGRLRDDVADRALKSLGRIGQRLRGNLFGLRECCRQGDDKSEQHFHGCK